MDNPGNMTRSEDHLEELLDELEAASKTREKTLLDLDETAFYIGQFPRDFLGYKSWYERNAEKRPILHRILQEIEPLPSPREAMMAIMDQRSREDKVGQVIDLVCHIYSDEIHRS